MAAARNLDSQLPESSDPLADIPPWSGEFYEFTCGDCALMVIHLDDTRMHPFPEGWVPQGEPEYLGVKEVWSLVRV